MNDARGTRLSAGAALIEGLIAYGHKTIFSVPGESFLPVLDALYDRGDRLRLIACRHEGAASVMAQATGRMTGRPGLCFVTRAPGAANAAIGLYTAFHDSTPMILFIGDIPRDADRTDAFQGADHESWWRPITKTTIRVTDAAQLPEALADAHKAALSGRPGPAAVILPEDVLAEPVEWTAAPASQERPGDAPGDEQRAAFERLLGRAARPVLLLGGSGWDAPGAAAIAEFVHANGVPVVTAFRRQDLFDNEDDHYAGDLGLTVNPALVAAMAEADLVIALGARLSDVTTQEGAIFNRLGAGQSLVHIHPDRGTLNRRYGTALAIKAAPGAFSRAIRQTRVSRPDATDAWRESLNRAYREWNAPAPGVGPVDLPAIYGWLNERLPDETVIANGAGNFAGWLHRYYRYRRYGTQLAPTSGAMGYGFPAALAAKARHPDRPVICVTGDGDFMMTGQDLATAVREALNVVVLLFNNASYGTIRMHQEKAFPARAVGTDLHNPDFAAYARSFGAHGATVRRTGEFSAAFEDAMAAGRPAVIDIHVPIEALSATTTLSALRGAER